jgi:diguanylate cyclase (GGDEF)-like protein
MLNNILSFYKNKTSTLRQSQFIIRCTFGISIVAIAIMLPFGINNFFQDRFFSGVTALLVAFLFIANAILALKGKYSLYLNLLSTVPALALASITALINLEVLGAFWSFVCVFAIYFVLPFRFAKHASWVYLLCVLSTAWVILEQDIAIRFCVALLSVTLFTFIFSGEMSRTKKALKLQAQTDPLTGLFNRTKLARVTSKAIREFTSSGIVSTICIIDVDHFKSINDNMGHEAGDNVLIMLASQLKSLTSHKDKVFRIGGEEFLLLLPNTPIAESELIAEAIRDVIATTSFHTNLDKNQPRTETFHVTVSIGMAQISEGFSAQQWINDADQKLYLAKQQGRNRVVM